MKPWLAGIAALLVGAVVAAVLLLAPTPSAAASRVCEARWHDEARDRDVPVRIRLPSGSGKVPLILFSHGLGGSLDAGTLWAEAWVADGNAVIHLQHPGSDAAAIGRGLMQAMSAEQLRNRAGDVHFVLDELARRSREGGCDLSRLDLGRVGMAGHSFGAQTTLAIAGTAYPFGSLADPRVRAAIGLSPQPAILDDARAFGAIRMPFLSITGSDDQLPRLNRITPRDRERPFRAMPAGGKYLLVVNGGTHAMFGGRDAASVPAHLQAVVAAATTLFWRASLRGDSKARAELDRLAATLGQGDRFERK